MSSGRQFAHGMQFEDQVRQIARALWEAEPGDGAPAIVDGKERDCIIDLEDITHYVECTTDKTTKKIKHDLDKMVDYRDRKANDPDNPRTVKLWIITQEEPTAHQRELCKAKKVQLLSLKEFRRKLFDGTSYLALRPQSAFGSARDPNNDDSQDVWSMRYQTTTLRIKSTDRTTSIADILVALRTNRIVALLGDYGMGKSLTIREIFRQLRAQYLKDNDGPVPVAVNLRDYWGRDRPAEVLERHAVDVGQKPSSLVRGFNARQLIILLDGFDETAAIPWAARNVQRLKEVRRKAVEIVRRFVEACRGRCGILIAGREHFFDSPIELTSALGLKDSDLIVELDEFNDQEAAAYLKSAGMPTDLPDWLPRRPLLLASFVAKKLLGEILAQGSEKEPADAWSKVIDATCEREARIHEFIDAAAIRNILEALASRSRSSLSGLGPISESDLAEEFRAETGANPDNTAWPLLLRLPGLGARDAQPGMRYFIDDQLLSALRAGPVARYADQPQQQFQATDWRHGLDELGILSVIAHLSGGGIASPKKLVDAARQAARAGSPTLSLDLAQCARVVAEDADEVDFRNLDIDGGYSPHIDLAAFSTPKNLVLRRCIINRVTCANIASPKFSIIECAIEHLEGVSRRELLPVYIDKTCEIGEFDPLATNAAVLKNDVHALPVRVLLTIIRKLYLQGGAGRKENAFFRGMGPEAARFVPDLLEIVRREGLASVTAGGRPGRVWHPLRSARARAYRLLESSVSGADPAVLEASALT